MTLLSSTPPARPPFQRLSIIFFSLLRPSPLTPFFSLRSPVRLFSPSAGTFCASRILPPIVYPSRSPLAPRAILPGRVRVTKQTAGTMDFQAYLRSYWLIFGGTVRRRAIKYPPSERPFRVSGFSVFFLPSLPFSSLSRARGRCRWSSSRSVSVFNRCCSWKRRFRIRRGSL